MPQTLSSESVLQHLPTERDNAIGSFSILGCLSFYTAGIDVPFRAGVRHFHLAFSCLGTIPCKKVVERG